MRENRTLGEYGEETGVTPRGGFSGETEAGPKGLQGLLTEDEKAALQEIRSVLNCQSDRLFAIEKGIQEREEAALRRSHSNARGDMCVRSEKESIAEWLRQNGIDDVDPDEIVLGHEDSPGPRGCSPHDPVGAITMDVLRALDRIETLIHTESPQTTAVLGLIRSFPRLSDDDSIHGQTDRSTDTSDLP